MLGRTGVTARRQGGLGVTRFFCRRLLVAAADQAERQHQRRYPQPRPTAAHPAARHGLILLTSTPATTLPRGAVILVEGGAEVNRDWLGGGGRERKATEAG